MSGTVYRHDKNLIKLMSDVYGLASYTNPLHPDIFPGVCKMEAEVVRISCNLFHGDEASCGTVRCDFGLSPLFKHFNKCQMIASTCDFKRPNSSSLILFYFR